MGKNFRETLDAQMMAPEFRAEWEAMEPERQMIRAIIEGREESNLTQKQLAVRNGSVTAETDEIVASGEHAAALAL